MFAVKICRSAEKTLCGLADIMLSANFLNLPSPHMDLEQRGGYVVFCVARWLCCVLCSEVVMLCFHSLTLLSCQLQMIRGERNV